MKQKKFPAETALDVEIGARIRSARLARGFSQTQLAHAIGLTFQQLQKYETGANRISVSRLYSLAAALNMTAAQFVDDGGKAIPPLLNPVEGDVLTIFRQLPPPAQRAMRTMMRAALERPL